MNSLKIRFLLLHLFLMSAYFLPTYAEVGASAAAALDSDSILDQKAQQERRWIEDGLFFLPYKQNYFLPWSFNTNPNSFNTLHEESSLKDIEMKFQLSVKISLARRVIRNRGNLYFGYTQLSMWQIYDRKASAPIRETNYEPELFMTFDTNLDVAGMKNKQAGFGFVHQSNGESDPFSRGWNRFYLQTALEKNNWVLTLKPWIRSQNDSRSDDNPHIERYMGYGEVRLSHSYQNRIFSILIRNNLRAFGNKGAIELGYTYPLGKALRGYVQYFNGYGETLLDYNHANNRLGIGIALSDWL